LALRASLRPCGCSRAPAALLPAALTPAAPPPPKLQLHPAGGQQAATLLTVADCLDQLARELQPAAAGQQQAGQQQALDCWLAAAGRLGAAGDALQDFFGSQPVAGVPQGPSRQRGEQLLRASWLMEQAAVDLKAALKPIGGLAAAQQRVQDFASTLAAAGQELAQQQAPQQGPEQALAAAGQCLLHGAQSAQEILQPAGAQALHILGTQVQAAAAQMRAAGAAPSLRGAKGLLSVAAGRLHGAGACLLGVPAEEQCVPGAWPPELRKRLPGVVRALLAAQQRLGRAGSKLLRGARSLARHLFSPSTTAAFKRDHVMLTDTTIVVRWPAFVCAGLPLHLCMRPKPGRG
jgi:hypothetical protein